MARVSKNRLPIAALSAALSACGGPIAGGAAPSELEVVPRGLEFGASSIGDESTQEIKIQNRGAGEVSVASVRLRGSGGATAREFRLVGIPGASLAPGETLRVTVAYRPEDSGEDLAELVIDSGLDELSIPLAGAGLDSDVPARPMPDLIDTPPYPSDEVCFPDLADGRGPLVFGDEDRGLPYMNGGDTLTGFSALPGVDGARATWSSEGGILVGAGAQAFLPVIANSFDLEADARIWAIGGDLELTLSDLDWRAGLRIRIAPRAPGAGGPAIAVEKVIAGATTELLASVTAGALGVFPRAGEWFHVRVTKRGGAFAVQIDQLEPLVFTDPCASAAFRLAVGSSGSVDLADLSVRAPR